MTDLGPTSSTARLTTYVDYLGDEPEAPPPPPRRKKMTKEERMERQRKRDIEFRKLEMTGHLKRELELAKKSVTRGKELWLQMCRQIKLDQMQKDLMSWEENANRVLNEKEDSIKFILDQIATTKQMHKRGFRVQLETLDYMKDIFRAIQDNLQLQYEKQCQEILHDFFNKTCEITEIQEAYVHKFHENLNATNESLEGQVFENFHKSLEKRNDAVNNEIINRYTMRDATAKKMYSIHNQLQEFVDALLNSSLDALKYAKVNHLMKRQRKFVTHYNKWNDSEMTKSKKLFEKQKELAQLEVEDKRKINDLRQVHAYYRNLYRSTENRIERNRIDTHEKLMVLTSECHEISKSVEKITKYGELLLSLSTHCRKLQTESEKVTLLSDFQELSLAEQKAELHEFTLQIIDLKSHIDLSEEELLAQMRLMRHFWRRQALAEAQTVLLEEKKRELLIENQHYIDKIKALSKADNVADLQKALKVVCILEETPSCFSNPCV